MLFFFKYYNSKNLHLYSCAGIDMSMPSKNAFFLLGNGF